MRCWVEKLGSWERTSGHCVWIWTWAVEHAHLYRSRSPDDGCCSYILYRLYLHTVVGLHACFFASLLIVIPHSLPVHSFLSLSASSASLSRVVRNVSLLFCPFILPARTILSRLFCPVPAPAFSTAHPRCPSVFYFCVCPCSFTSRYTCKVCLQQGKGKCTSPSYDDSPGNPLSFWPLVFGPPRPSDLRQLNYSPAGFIGGATDCSGCRPNCPSGELATGKEI